VAGGFMSGKIKVLDIEIDELTAKEAMKDSMSYLESEPVNIIELVTADGLMQISEVQDLKEHIGCFDLILAGDKTILEVAQVKEWKFLQETENRTFLKMFMRYLHKNHKRVYLLVNSTEEGEELYNYFECYYSGIQIVGLAKVSAENRADDMLVNAINGGEIDCVIAALIPPLQEEFIVKNKGLLNTRLWLGLGTGILPLGGTGNSGGRLARFVVKHMFRRRMEKRKNKID